MAEEITLQTDTQIEEETFSNRSYNVSQTAIRGFVDELEALPRQYGKGCPRSSMSIRFTVFIMELTGET